MAVQKVNADVQYECQSKPIAYCYSRVDLT
jgi:hypothetical protein